MNTPGSSRREVSVDVLDKRKKPLSSKSQAQAKSANAVSKPKRLPFKRQAQTGSSRINLTASIRPSKTPRTGSLSSMDFLSPPTRPSQLSLLEALPVELLEPIFLYSLNPNLTLASPVLAKTVFRERTYRSMILLAFWNAPVNPGKRCLTPSIVTNLLSPLRVTWISQKERAHLQESILRCNWCTLQRMRALLPDLSTLMIYRRGITVFKPMNDADDASMMEGMPRMEVPPLSLFSFPAHLVQGSKRGFSDDDVAFLEMLRTASGSSTFEWVTDDIIPRITPKVDRNALHNGVEKALYQRNLAAVISLLKIDEYVFRCRKGLSRSFYTIPSAHFITATRVSPDDPSSFLVLLRASAESIPADDATITQWAFDLIAVTAERLDVAAMQVAAFGRWLCDWMLQLPQQIENARLNPAGRQLFFVGRLNYPLRMGQRLLDEICPPSDWMQPWLGESPFKIDDERAIPNFRRNVDLYAGTAPGRSKYSVLN